MTQDKYGTELSVGNWVQVIARSKKCNAHINNMGYVGEVVAVYGDEAVELECLNGGMGAVDANCVKLLKGKPTEAEIHRYRYDRY